MSDAYADYIEDQTPDTPAHPVDEKDVSKILGEFADQTQSILDKIKAARDHILELPEEQQMIRFDPSASDISYARNVEKGLTISRMNLSINGLSQAAEDLRNVFGVEP